MGTAAVILAAVAARTEREYVEHFRLAGATTPERAIPLPEPDQMIGRRQVERWKRAGVLRPGPGGYWLDEAALVQHGDARRQTKMLVVLALVSLALLIVGLGVVLTNRAGELR